MPAMAFQVVITSTAIGVAAAVLTVLTILFLAIFFLKDADFPVLWASRRMPPQAFKNKVVWIVGASSGIGEALAYELATRGASLILSGRRVDRLMAVSERCMDEGSPDVFVLRTDIEAFDSHAVIVEQIVKKFGRVDYLINNAGRSQRSLIELTPLEIDRQMFQGNVFGVLSITKALLPQFIKQGHGHIVNTSSVAGKIGSPCSATYAATKHAIQGYFDSLRMECAEHNISVTNVCPGPVTSEITLHAFTETVGKEYSSPQEDSIKRMSAERCAHLMAAAMWAQLSEIWVSPQPILFFTYMGQYFPSLYFYLGPIVGKARVAAFRRGQQGYDSIQNPLSLLAGIKSTPTAAVKAAPTSIKQE